MRKLPRAAALALALLVLAAPLALAALRPASYTEPRHRDAWTFATTVGTGASAANSTTDEAFDAQTIITVNGSNVTVDEWTIRTTDAHGVTIETRDSRPSDGADVRILADFVPNGSSAPTFHSEQTYDPPCVRMKWPLTVGASWTSTCPFTSNGTDTPLQRLAETTSYKVDREERITVPAGTFDTFVILVTPAGSATVTQWYSPTACRNAKEVNEDPRYPSTTLMTAYACSNAPSDPTDGSGAPVSTPTTTSPATGASGGSATTTTTTTPIDTTVNQKHRSPGAGTTLATVGLALAAVALAARKRS